MGILWAVHSCCTKELLLSRALQGLSGAVNCQEPQCAMCLRHSKDSTGLPAGWTSNWSSGNHLKLLRSWARSLQATSKYTYWLAGVCLVRYYGIWMFGDFSDQMSCLVCSPSSRWGCVFILLRGHPSNAELKKGHTHISIVKGLPSMKFSFLFPFSSLTLSSDRCFVCIYTNHLEYWVTIVEYYLLNYMYYDVSFQMTDFYFDPPCGYYHWIGPRYARLRRLMQYLRSYFKKSLKAVDFMHKLFTHKMNTRKKKLVDISYLYFRI